MKILHITNNYPTKNYPIFGIFVKEQIDSLNDLGLENEVFFINGRENGKLEYLKSIFKLRSYLKGKNFDIVHCHHAFSALILLLTLKSSHKTKIVSYQNDPDREGGIRLFRIMHRFFNGIILKNNKADYMSSKTFYLPNGVNTDFFKPYLALDCENKLKLNPGNNYILFMDSYNRRPQKRIDRFLETIEILKKEGNPYRIEPLILTNINRDLIPFYMGASVLHLLSSDFEGSPNSVKECLACNTKVVSTPVGNVKDLIGDIPGCFISNSFEPCELADLVIKSIKIEKFEGRSFLISKELDIKSVAKKLSVYYKKINNG